MSVVNSSVALPAEVSKDRFARGSATFAAVTGIPTEEYLDGFKDSSPDFGRYVIEWVFGDVYSRTDLDLKTRELVIIAAGAALGATGIDVIKFHVPTAVRAGATRDQIFGVLTQVAIVAGVHTAIAAISAAAQVLGPHSQVADDSSVALPAEVSKDRFARGSATFAAVTGIPTEEYLDGFKDSSPDFGRYVIEWVFGDVYSRTDLDLKTRELVIIAAGAALGATGIDVIKFHVPTAVRAGATRDQIFGVLTQVAIVAGVPTAIAAISAAAQVLEPHSQVADPLLFTGLLRDGLIRDGVAG